MGETLRSVAGHRSEGEASEEGWPTADVEATPSRMTAIHVHPGARFMTEQFHRSAGDRTEITRKAEARQFTGAAGGPVAMRSGGGWVKYGSVASSRNTSALSGSSPKVLSYSGLVVCFAAK